MRLTFLGLENIGPFKRASIDFIGKDNNTQNPPITIITGENGTGKTIILDAIRAVLSGEIERDIVRDERFYISLLTTYSRKHGASVLIQSNEREESTGIFKVKENTFTDFLNNKKYPKWILNYWTSKVSAESLDIQSLIRPNPTNFLVKSLDGIQRNTEVIELITHFDYLRTSEDKKEKEIGETLFKVIKKIIKKSLTNGELKYVSRTKLMPIISQLGYEIELSKLSSGNLYLIQRMIGLLGQMYAVAQLHDLPIEDICKTPGVLLIDEAENHLHPKWQKTFLNDILEIFPNLQIIVTTHSPFIVSSVENARVYVCESRIDHAEVVDRTSDYSNRPIEEVLVSPVFDTIPFNSKITSLLERRKAAIQSGNKDLENQIEAELKRLNPNHFAYLDIEQLLESMTH